MAKEYKNRGGDYSTPKSDKDESQQHLEKWDEEEWQTKDGSANARTSDGSRKRYLPKKAWEEMSEGEKEETEEKKVEGSKEGRQVVGNTENARTLHASEGMMAGETQWAEEKSMGDGGREGRMGAAVASGIGVESVAVAVASRSAARWTFLRSLRRDVEFEAPRSKGRRAASAGQLRIRYEGPSSRQMVGSDWKTTLRWR